MAKEVRLEGLENVLETLTNLVDEDTIRMGLGQACALVERSAKQKAQSFADTGALVGSITSKVEDDTGIVYTPLEYAPYVEYGTGLFAEEGGRKDVPWCYQDDKGEWHTTSGQHPQPYMRPALDENREEIKRILREGLLND